MGRAVYEQWRRREVVISGRDANELDLVQLSRATDGLTGGGIENVFVESLFHAFDAGKEPTDLPIAQILTEFIPLSKLMAESITGLRNWAKGRARSATSPSPERKFRKMAV